MRQEDACIQWVTEVCVALGCHGRQKYRESGRERWYYDDRFQGNRVFVISGPQSAGKTSADAVHMIRAEYQVPERALGQTYRVCGRSHRQNPWKSVTLNSSHPDQVPWNMSWTRLTLTVARAASLQAQSHV